MIPWYNKEQAMLWIIAGIAVLLVAMFVARFK